MTELKEIQQIAKNVNVPKVVAFGLAYFFTLFFIGVGIIMLYDRLYHIDFNSPSYVGIVAAIFILTTLTDLILLSKNKITLTLLAWFIVLSPLLVLYKYFKDADLLSLNKNSTPAKVKKYVFPWHVANF